MSIKTAFLSSTARDLAQYREKVYQAIEGLTGYHCVRMEDFTAADWEADDFCRAKVTECGLLVGIVGHLYGSCPEGGEQSYTEREYEAAVIAGIPRLMFFAPEDFPLPANLIESDEKRQKQHAFRERVSRERVRDTFTSPEDLARRVVQAIRNWEQEEAVAQRRPVTAHAEGVMPLPPQPYFAHPYPLQENFTGRVSWRQMLTEWLTEGQQPVLALVAIGGMGKSALTWAWLLRDVIGLPLLGGTPEPPEASEACRVPETARPEGVLWWSFYEREAGFAAFLDEGLTYASSGSVDPVTIPSAHEKVKALVTLLQQRRIMLVMDGFERELRAYVGLSAAYQGDAVAEDAQDDFRGCTDPHAANFLRSMASLPIQSRVLITSRLYPSELDDLAGCRQEELTSLDPEDAVTFFYAQGVDGTRAEIEAACEPYGYHPLALRLLSGLIVRDKQMPGDIQVADRYPVVPELKGKEKHHILQVSYDALDRRKRPLLSRIAAFRSPMNYDAISTFNTFKSDKGFDKALDELMDRGLMFFDQERRLYDLHPIVRQYAYDRLADKKGAHTRLRDYFAALPAPDRVETLEDLAPVIELYYHTVGAGQYDQAVELLYDRRLIPDLLYFRFGAYQTSIELIRALFPEGEDRPPRLKTKRNQSWTANELANSYNLSGQPRRAVSLFRVSAEIDEGESDKESLAVTLGNLAISQLIVGELAAAEGSLRQCIELGREIPDERNEAIAHRELGRMLAYRGAFDEAARELDAAQASFSKLGHTQSECVTWAYHAQRALLMGEAKSALEAARQARGLADKVAKTIYPVERDFIQTEWLMGAALVALASEERGRQSELLAEAESHLTEALTRCRRINLVDVEPDILLAWARWNRAKGNEEQAHRDADEALDIADRCEYRLKQADTHNFLAKLALESGDGITAKERAKTARERAECDGEPHWYKPALDEAERLIKEVEQM